MTRLFLASLAVVSALAVVPSAGEAQKPTPMKGAPPKSNQVYVKIILPIAPTTRDKDRPVVESWIAEQLKKRGQSKFTAATAWVPLVSMGLEVTEVWDGKLDGKRWIQGGRPVDGDIPERADDRIKVVLFGWHCFVAANATVELKDEPGSRAIAGVGDYKDDSGMPYVAVLIGPPPENPAAPTDPKK